MSIKVDNNKLILIKELPKRIRGHKVGLYRCKCGVYKELSISNVSHNRIKSCGCVLTKAIDIVGKRFGRLLVLREDEVRTDRHVRWVCVCECGKEVVVLGNTLKNGNTKSCGCYTNEFIRQSKIKHGQNTRERTTPEYNAWMLMKYRCCNEKYPEFRYYGGRGIRVCDRWLNSFEAFYQDMGNRPSNIHSLDRFPNTNGDYGPENCRWATPRQQNGNKRSNVWISYNGMRMIKADWARFMGATPQSLNTMMKKKTFGETYNYYVSKGTNKC